jgi:ABC-type hemin transport system substrate-binding protein
MATLDFTQRHTRLIRCRLNILLVLAKGRVAALVILLGLALVWLFVASIAASSSAPVTIVDDLGRKVTIRSSERIVAIGPSVTETLYALGLGDRVVGVDRYSDYPPEAVAKQKVSSWWTPGSGGGRRP